MGDATVTERSLEQPKPDPVAVDGIIPSNNNSGAVSRTTAEFVAAPQVPPRIDSLVSNDELGLEPQTVRVSGGAALVMALVRRGVDSVFTLPGAQMYSFCEALRVNADTIRSIQVHHEQSAGLAAFGYAKSSGKPGVFAVVPGPGVLNSATALNIAKATCTPVLLITVAIPSEFEGKGRGHLHEVEDQLGTLKSVTKWTCRVSRAQDVFAAVDEAFDKMLSGRQGPVVIEMPWDVAAAPDSVWVPSSLLPPLPRPSDPSPDQISQLATLLSEAKRPLIVVGAGALDASAELRELSSRLAIPVAAFRSGRGIVPEVFSPALLGSPLQPSAEDVINGPIGISPHVGSLLFPKSDLVLGIGSRMELPFLFWGEGRFMKYISRADDPRFTDNSGKRIKVARIDVDPEEKRRLTVDCFVGGDAKVVLQRLLGHEALKGKPEKERQAYREEIKTLVTKAYEQAIAKVQPDASIVACIRRALPANGILIDELCQAGFASLLLYPHLEPRTFVSSGYTGVVGSGFASALGAKVAHPDLPVVSLTGDGGLLFGIMELATAARCQIGIVCLVFNNAGYRNVSRDQQRMFGHAMGSEWKAVKFAEVAKAMGYGDDGVKVVDLRGIGFKDPIFGSKIAELNTALVACLEYSNGAKKGPSMVEVLLDEEEEGSPWEFLMPTLDWGQKEEGK